VPLNFGWPNYISATFNKGVDINSINYSSLTLSSPEGSVPGTISFDEANNTLNFSPSLSLAIGTAYTATVSSSLMDYFGGTLGTSYSWSFTTMEKIPLPTISPPSGSFEVDTVVTVEIQSIPGAAIYYTVDGNSPTAPYPGPFQLTIYQMRSVLAKAARSGMIDSEVVMATYRVKP
jgi:hypothetical protein